MNWKLFFSATGWIFAFIAFVGEMAQWQASIAVVDAGEPMLHRMALAVWPGQAGIGDPITHVLSAVGCERIYVVLASIIAATLAAALYDALHLELTKWRVEELELQKLFQDPGGER